ncbi:MAG TPA: hypothetical protein V6C86_18060 [Oculatellaceae cyanobacterium]
MELKKVDKGALVELFVISLISLYFELVIIRWLSSEIRIFAYFKNVPLMACLFGLGLGMALANSKRDLTKWFPIGLLVLTVLICFANPLHLVHVSFINPIENYIIGNAAELNLGPSSDTLQNKFALFLPGLGVLICVFYLIVGTFASIGQRIGRLFDSFPPLVAYSVNVAASLLGILLFSTVSFLSWPPPVWLAIGVATCIFYFRKPAQVVCLAASLAVAFFTLDAKVMWSPYYRISVKEMVFPADAGRPDFHYGYNINVNYDAIEGAYNNNPKVIENISSEQRKQTADYYDAPYIALGDKPRSILILAAGTGNDVAAALRHGATDIDAIEIDPTIAKLGRELHPEKPYSNSNVHLIVNDARAFLRRSQKKYDLIVFAYLDSHSAFSSMSSLRLDNYVYTKDAFQDAMKLLKPDGVVSCTFYYLNWWQLARVYRSFERGTGLTPTGIFSPMGNGPTLLAGPGLDKNHVERSGLKLFSIPDAAKQWNFIPEEWTTVEPTTDDWPYLFLRDRGFSWTYGIGILFTLFLGYKLVGRCFGKFATNRTGLTMFFLGAAFMLIETKSVTQMGLLLGTTWLVNSAVITAVLIMILAATLIQLKFGFKKLGPLFTLLFLSLVLTYVVPLSALNSLDATTAAAIGSLMLSTPLLFAAMIFAIVFGGVNDPGKALGMNLLGTLVGGALEYSSMTFGVNFMNVIAILLYACAYFFARQNSASQAEHGDNTTATESPA